MEIKQKNITIEDVQNVIDNEENNIVISSTNASEIRKILGRGSFATIQKFLNKIREDLNDKDVDLDDSVKFEMNKESVNELVSVINKSVKFTVLEKLNTLNVVKDKLNDDLIIANNDNVELLEEVERLESLVSEKDTLIIETAKDFEQRELAFENEITSLNARLEEAHGNNEKLEKMFEKLVDKMK